MTKVSVYIPTHNYAEYIKKAVHSVLTQTMTDWELIIINDGSTDNTIDILKKYQDHPKIRVIDQENKGLNVTNNIALRLARGQYVMRLDADDYLDENALLVLSNTLDSRPDVDLVYPDYYLINKEGEVVELVRRKKVEEEVQLLDLPAHGACTMFRTRVLKQIGGYIESFSCQDGYEIWLRFIQKHKPYNVNIPLFYYRQHSKSLTKNLEKILGTRRRIKSKFIEKYKNGERPKVLGLIPVVRKSIYPQADPFVDLGGKPLLWYTISEALKADTLDRIVLSSEDDEVLEYVRQFKRIIPLKRPYELAKFTSSEQDIAIHVLDSLKEASGYEPEVLCILYITTPLRRAYHIDKAVDTMTIFDVDTVLSIQEELSLCYHHRRFGLTPLNGTRRDLKVERNAIFKENGAIYLMKRKVLEKGYLLGERIGHITMLPWESVKINSEYDFWLADKILQDWPKTNTG